MSQDRSSDQQSWHLAAWIIKSLVTAGIFYLFAFSVLVFFPQIAKALVRIGISENILETIFYPIFKLIGVI